MKDDFELKIQPDGTIATIYQDGLADLLDAETLKVERASKVEWEDIGVAKGWSVRAAHNPNLAIRMRTGAKGGLELFVSDDDSAGGVAVFTSREMALEREQFFIWELLEERKV